MTDLFISYARVDRGRIEVLAALLEQQGYSVWWDRQIVAGTAFDKEIERALADARCVIVAWSEHSVGSDWVRAEAAFALETNKLVPIALDRSHPPIRFIHTHTLDLTDWDGAPAHPSCERLISDLRELIGPPGETHERPLPARPARADARAGFDRPVPHMPPRGSGSGGAVAVAMDGGLGSAVAAPSFGGKGTRIGLIVFAVLILLVAAHIAYPKPLLSLLGKDTEGIKTEIGKRLEALRCATVNVAVSQDYLFRTNVQLSGIVSVDDDVQNAADLARVRDVASVGNALQVVPWPFCEVINTVQTTLGNPAPQAAPRIDSDQADMVFKDGDRLVLKVGMTPLFDGYLYVDYIDGDGTVAHMLPNPRRQDNKAKAGAEVKVGAAKGETGATDQAYEVSAPFGKRMILVTAARKPLFNQPRDQVEAAASYIPALQAAFNRARSGEKDVVGAVSVYRFLTTQEK
jgi:hypothetical protein